MSSDWSAAGGRDALLALEIEVEAVGDGVAVVVVADEPEARPVATWIDPVVGGEAELVVVDVAAVGPVAAVPAVPSLAGESLSMSALPPVVDSFADISASTGPISLGFSSLERLSFAASFDGVGLA